MIALSKFSDVYRDFFIDLITGKKYRKTPKLSKEMLQLSRTSSRCEPYLSTLVTGLMSPNAALDAIATTKQTKPNAIILF